MKFENKGKWVKQINESSQVNEGGIAHIRKLGPNSVWKGPKYKENEYMVALYDTDFDFRRGISFFSNPKERSLSKQDAINYVKEKWPGYKIVIDESAQKNESLRDLNLELADDTNALSAAADKIRQRFEYRTLQNQSYDEKQAEKIYLELRRVLQKARKDVEALWNKIG